jgi:hypothetical protein
METLATQLSQLNEQVHAALNDFLVARRLTHINQQELQERVRTPPYKPCVSYGWAFVVGPHDPLLSRTSEVVQKIRDSLEREPVDKWAYLNIMLQLRANDNRFSIEVTVSLAPPS